MNFFSTICLIAPIKNIKQNIEENIVQCWFYETSINILRLISKAPLTLFLICHQNSNVDSPASFWETLQLWKETFIFYYKLITYKKHVFVEVIIIIRYLLNYYRNTYIHYTYFTYCYKIKFTIRHYKLSLLFCLITRLIKSFINTLFNKKYLKSF